MAGRRILSFGHLDEVPAEVDRLLAGHDRAGSWSLGQALFHLAAAIGRSTDGRTPPPGLPGHRADVMRRMFFRAGRFPDGLDVPVPELVPPASADNRDEARALGLAIGRFIGSDGPFPSHPVLGPLTGDEWDVFHRIHCAHHLGFFSPATGGDISEGDPG